MADDPIRRSTGLETSGMADPVEKVTQAIRSITANAGKTASGARSEAGNPMLEALVYGDNDLVGLVAYAMHEVNRRDWCMAYESAHGRPPVENEVKAYLVGEQLERRLDTYRRLAEDSLAKIALGEINLRRLVDGGDTPRGSAQQITAQASAAPVALAQTVAVKPAPSQPKQGRMGMLIIYLFALLVAVVGVAYALRTGIDLTSFGK